MSEEVNSLNHLLFVTLLGQRSQVIPLVESLWDYPGKNIGVPFPPPGDLSNLGIELTYLLRLLHR